MLEDEKRISRRTFLRLATLAAGSGLLAACTNGSRILYPQTTPTKSAEIPRPSPSCVNLVILPNRSPFSTDLDGVPAANYVDDFKNPRAAGFRLMVLDPQTLSTARRWSEVSRVDPQFGVGIAVQLELDNRTINVIGDSRDDLAGRTEWGFKEAIDISTCHTLSAVWSEGRIVDALLNGQRPASLRIVI